MRNGTRGVGDFAHGARPGRCDCLCSASANGSCPEPHRNPHRHRQGRTGRRPRGCARQDQFAGTDWRSGDADHQRQGQLRFPSLPPGLYAFAVELQGFTPYHEDGHAHRRGRHHRANAVLKVAGLAESVVVEGRAHASKHETPDSERASVPRTSTRSRRDGRACSTSSGPRLACRRPRRQAVSLRPSPCSARARTRTCFSSMA